jgi:hypothetical protein
MRRVASEREDCPRENGAGAHVRRDDHRIEGNFDDALRIVRELGETGKVEVVNSINPVRIEGQKTAALKFATNSGAHRITIFCRLGTRETSPPIGGL